MAVRNNIPFNLQETVLDLADTILVFEVISPTAYPYIRFGVAVFTEEAFCILVKFLMQRVDIVAIIVGCSLKPRWSHLNVSVTLN